MPKEITHWWLALEALGELRAAGGGARSFSELLDRNRNLFLLGSVGPDFLFYYLAGPERESFRDAAMVLHGTDGGDTLAVLARTAERYGGSPPEGVSAFLYGYACHVAADSVFHPMVLYFAGKGGDGARYSHHLFESVLDLYVTDVLRPGPELPLRVRELTAGMEMSGGDFLDLLGLVSFGGSPYDRRALASCLRRYEFLQGAFWNPLGQAAARLLAGVKPGLRHFESSFYQRRFHRMAPSFGKPLIYRHPVTGGQLRDTIQGLRDKMTERCVEMGGVFGRAFGDGAAAGGAAETLREIRGANLETGIYGDTAKNILYTAPGGTAEVFGAG